MCGHTRPLCTLLEKQLSESRVYQGRPLLLLTTQTTTVWADETTVWVNSSVKIYWKTIFQGPMFIRGSPYNTTHITTVWAHTTTVWADETTVWVKSPVKTYWKTPFKGPMFIRGSPYKTIHITPVWPHTTTVYPTGKQISRPHVYEGLPLEHTTHNHCVCTYNRCVHYWKTTFRAPCL